MNSNVKKLSEITDEDIAMNFDKLRVNFKAYAAVNIKIKNKAGEVQPFTFNRMQLKLWEMFQEDRASGNLFRWMIVKERQGGVTTWVLGLFHWLCTMSSNKNALVLAHEEKAAQAMGGKLQNYYLRSRKILKPSVRKMNRAEIHYANSLEESERTGNVGIDCHVDVATADSKGLGRSYTYQYSLWSEFCIWPEVGIDVEARLQDLAAAIPDLPESIIIIESTAKGENYGKEFWDNTDNGYRKIFISWLSDDEYRVELPLSQYFELSELPDSKYGDETVERQHVQKELKIWYSKESQNKTWLEHETMCRLAWRRRMIDTKYNGKKHRFKQEYPTTVNDAFASSADTVFDYERLIEMSEQVRKSNHLKKTFRYQHDDGHKDETRKFYDAKYGHLRVYENTIPGATYVVGGDGAMGVLNGDESSLVVLKLPNLVEVATFSDVIIPNEFAGVANYLSRLYNLALLGIEINDRGGFAAIEKLVHQYNYPNLYYSTDPMDIKVSNKVRYGWITNDITRQLMISDLTTLINNNQIHLRSGEIIDQLKTFVKHPKTGKFAASNGKHDDLVIALMVAVQMGKAAHIKLEKPVTNFAPKGSCNWHIQEMKRRSRLMYR